MRRGEHLLILGASTRAAAMSAVRAGFQPWCADLFADEDLRRICPVERIAAHDYPHGFAEISRRAPPGPWMYTGGLENHPRLVEQISRQRTLLGTKAAVLRKVRSPFVVAQYLKRAGLPCPAVARSPEEIPAGGRWLIKPRRSSGGRGIRFWTGREGDVSRLIGRGVYFQEFIEGEPIAAVFSASEEGVSLYGVTQQLVGQGWLHAAPFHYCGSIATPSFNALTLRTLQMLGTALAEHFRLRGLFGIDCVLRDGIPWPVELNPRYTASVEVLEQLSQTPALASEPRPSGSGADVPPLPDGRGSDVSCFGKALLFAQARCLFPDDGPWIRALSASESHRGFPAFADIPRPGDVLGKGRPILTFFASAVTVADCEKKLREIAARLDDLLLGS